MNLPDEAPKLSPWPFLAVDAVLFGAAAFIAGQSSGPLIGTRLVVVAVLIFLGALLAVVPFVVNYTRRQEAALEERLKEIAALAQTTAASAEQLSIAVASLHGISETAAKSVKHAELLPQKLQEKIHEFRESLNEVSVSENEALSQEVNTLRAAETERIETVLSAVRKLSGDIARLETASQKHITELNDTLAQFKTSAEQAAVEATTAVASLRASAEKSLASAHSSSLGALEETLSDALSEIDAKLASVSGHLGARIESASQSLDGRLAALEKLAERLEKAAAASSYSSVSIAEGPLPAPVAPESRAETSPGPFVAPSDSAAISVMPEVVATSTVEAPRQSAETGSQTESAEEPRPAKKRLARRQPTADELGLGLDLGEHASEFSQLAPDESATAVSADGVTRLLVTAYIGIGNKLFLRGEGPGLNWDQGVALQFVSIGKWRWECADANSSVRGKLYKNDEIECEAVGEITIEAGHQVQVTATF